MHSSLLMTVLVVIGVVVGESEGFVVRKVAEDDNSNSVVNGTRVTDSLQHIIVVSSSNCYL